MKWRDSTEDDFTEDWMFNHYRYKFSYEKLDTDLFEVKEGCLKKIGGTGVLDFKSIEILDESPAFPVEEMTLPNDIDLLKLKELLMFSDRYEISVQFWPNQVAVYIEKDGVDLKDFGGDADCINDATIYLTRITGGFKNVKQ